MRCSIALLFVIGCSSVEQPHDHGDENEVITTVELTFTPDAGGEPVVAVWAENGGDPLIDVIELGAGGFTLDVAFLNELSEPSVDITVEVADEAEEHQVFFTGNIAGPAVLGDEGALALHAYTDVDANSAPLGLQNAFEVTEEGSGELIVTLRHFPEEAGVGTKPIDAADSVAADGFGGLPGDNDVQVAFPLVTGS